MGYPTACGLPHRSPLMTIAVDARLSGDGLTSSMTGSSATASFLSAGPAFFSSQRPIWPSVAGLPAPPLSPPGTPTASPPRTWKVATFSPLLCPPPLMRWVTACCSSGALKPRVTSSLVSARRPLGLRCPPRCLRADRLHAASVRDRSSSRHPPLQRHRLLRPDCGFRQRLPDLPPRPEQLVLRALLRCGCDLPLPPLPPGLPQLDPEPLPHDGRGRHPRRRTSLRHSRCHRGKHPV